MTSFCSTIRAARRCSITIRRGGIDYWTMPQVGGTSPTCGVGPAERSFPTAIRLTLKPVHARRLPGSENEAKACHEKELLGIFATSLCDVFGLAQEEP